MNITILGAGITGVSTAYECAKQGFNVTVIDRNPGPAQECSYANGGQLSYSHAEPWARPYLLRRLPGWLINRNSPIFFTKHSKDNNARLLRWLTRFFGYCTNHHVRKTTEHILTLALKSKEKLHAIQQEHDLNFHHNACGTLHYFSRASALRSGLEQAMFQTSLGCNYEHLTSFDACIEKEPALAYNTRSILGGIYYPDDEVGDIHLFCQQLTKVCEAMNVTFEYNTLVTGIHSSSDRITHIQTNRGKFEADHYISCLGAYNPELFSPLGITLPIYPLKGYSLTIPIINHDKIPTIALTDQAHKVVVSKLGNHIRIAGMAEFSGYNHDITPGRIETLTAICKHIIPQGLDYTQLKPWACLRPATPSCRPIIGQSPIKNLYLNTGHGTLGWTLACGSADKIVKIVMDNLP